MPSDDDTHDFRSFDRLPWELNKRIALEVARGLRDGGQLGEYDRLADRITRCGRVLEFDRYDTAEGTIPRLVGGEFCRSRMCPTCMRLRSRKLHYQLSEVLDLYTRRNPTDQALLITLTIRNCVAEELADTLSRLMEALRRFVRAKRFKRAFADDSGARSWFRTLEITRNAETGAYHPHLHLLVMAPNGYFQRDTGRYLTQDELAELWGTSLHADYRPVVDIRPIKGVGGGRLTDIGRKSLREVTKYVTKFSDLVSSDSLALAITPEELCEVHEALRGRRLIGKSGTFRALSAELDQVDVDEPDADWGMPDRLPPEAIYLGRERWEWRWASQTFEIFDLVFVPPERRRETG
ncbi:protein rep [Rhodoplanes sp. TEM]|uniref:Protein rep n=1 Tax=Rhodoplanes tepidamans TaxID=200616 RepID=A0ABT5J616_RHOTP|nr:MULTISPECIES: protein rep [Rhodoplanes]MDC7785086.1 protein rep [Rhodoplanes tepidamans]MDC7982560.1 protein rep [Rhodoplanes sp. TEM]MDQ0356576.1 plasmid rolling circle replication initiator protein Rep [Rhodoplanes tepidamans]